MLQEREREIMNSKICTPDSLDEELKLMMEQYEEISTAYNLG